MSALNFSGTTQKCKVCAKTVYPMDQLSVDGTPYHRSCFRCSICRSTLQIVSYHSCDGALYCKQHYDQIQSKSLHPHAKSSEDEGLPAEPADGVNGATNDAPNDAEPTDIEHAAEENTPIPEVPAEEAVPPPQELAEDVKSPVAGTKTPPAEITKPSPSKATPEHAAKAGSRTASMFHGTQDKCATCGKTAYPLEKVTVEGQNFHKSCFRCSHGGCPLSPANYAALEGILYCKPHFAQLFKEKGSYNHLIKCAAAVKHAAEADHEPANGS